MYYSTKKRKPGALSGLWDIVTWVGDVVLKGSGPSGAVASTAMDIITGEGPLDEVDLEEATFEDYQKQLKQNAEVQAREAELAAAAAKAAAEQKRQTSTTVGGIPLVYLAAGGVAGWYFFLKDKKRKNPRRRRRVRRKR